MPVKNTLPIDEEQIFIVEAKTLDVGKKEEAKESRADFQLS